MNIHIWRDIISSPHKIIDTSVAISIGVFDGVHRGHRRLIHSVVNFSKHTDSLVITFKDNPARVLGRKTYCGDILNLDQKLQRFEALGVKKVILVDFSIQFSKLTGKEFINRLCECLDIEKIVIGYNFRFGHGRNTNSAKLEKMLAHSRIEVEIVEPSNYKNEPISSSRIRNCITVGDFDAVREMMEADFILDLTHTGNCERDNEKIVIKRDSLNYCLPMKGKYRVLNVTARRTTESIACIEADYIGIQHRDRLEAIQKLIFLEKIQ